MGCLGRESFRPELFRPCVVSANIGELFRPDFSFNPILCFISDKYVI